MSTLSKFISLLFLTLIYSRSICQNFAPIKLTKAEIKSNALENFSLSINFLIDKNPDEITDDEYNVNPNKPKAHLSYSDRQITNADNKSCELSIVPYLTKSGFGFKITVFNNASIKQFLAKDNQISVEVDDDIKIKLLKSDGKTTSRFVIIKKEDVNKIIRQNLSINDEVRTSYVTYLNNFYYYQNAFDFGVAPAKGSSETSYFLTFQVQNRYDSKSFLSCEANSSNKIPHLFWNIDGRVSTNFSDSLNFINYYPVNVKWSNYTTNTPYEINIKLGNEANQTFSNKRVVFDGSYTFIIPNLINLTTAASNRLRLKPIITAGIKGYHDYSNNTTHFSSGQVYLNIHYYIPVLNSYAIILEGMPFYDFSKEKNPDQKVKNNYSIILGAEIPGTGFKAMFKYVNGTSDITFKQGQIIALGLLMDLFQEKNK